MGTKEELKVYIQDVLTDMGWKVWVGSERDISSMATNLIVDHVFKHYITGPWKPIRMCKEGSLVLAYNPSLVGSKIKIKRYYRDKDKGSTHWIAVPPTP